MSERVETLGKRGVPALTRGAPGDSVARRDRGGIELLDPHPAVHVQESEYRRLLGYPRQHTPAERALELADWARRWYAENGRPWVYLREAELEVDAGTLRIDGTDFQSRQLHDQLRRAGARRAMLVAVSAGRNCEDHARQLWQEAKPDEYFFLEIFGSAVVEHLVATMSGRICDLAERGGLMAIPHYSPGYTGWDIADQNRLFPLIADGATQPFPEPLEVLPSGMLRPKKSLLAVFGLVARTAEARDAAPLVPCGNCAFAPCQYRRAPYRHAASRLNGAAVKPGAGANPLTRGAKYSVGVRALQKWSGERVRIERCADGTTQATFRFDGTTCSNMGQPLAFDYTVTLSPPVDGYKILRADCRPAEGEEGYKHMCAYLADADELMHAIATEKPLLGRPLDDVLAWTRASAPSGCHCSADSRAHKWGLALEAIHYTLAQTAAPAAQS